MYSLVALPYSSRTMNLAETMPRSRARRTAEIATVLILAALIAVSFWSFQRYPALLKKLHAGSRLSVSGTISFDALLKTDPTMTATERIARTSVNWLWTNRFGMYFALPFGAAMMTLLQLIQRPKRFESAAANVFCGAAAGAPLGVCTNCATPIAQSLLLGGASPRLTISAMISSPSFNPVVLAMTFALFPTTLAVMRVVAPAILLCMLPFLVSEHTPSIRRLKIEEQPPLPARLAGLVPRYFRNLLRITLLTAPWMVLAAVLGAAASEMIPAYATGLPVSALGVIGVAIFGTLLPVPMAFDVALSWVLFHAGVPMPYIAALLCTLGLVSVYSLSATGQLLSVKTALRLGVAVATIGSLFGLALL